MQQPARKVDGGRETGNGLETGNPKLRTGRAFWEPTPERRRAYVRDLAEHKLWMGIVEYARDNRGTIFTALAALTRAWREIVQFREMERVYCNDADRILAFVAKESVMPEIGKRAVADIVLMGDTIGDRKERVFKGQLLTGIAIEANPEVARYALEQMAMLGMKLELKYVAEAFVGMSHMGTRKYAKALLAKMEASDLESNGHGC